MVDCKPQQRPHAASTAAFPLHVNIALLDLAGENQWLRPTAKRRATQGQHDVPLDWTWWLSETDAMLHHAVRVSLCKCVTMPGCGRRKKGPPLHRPINHHAAILKVRAKCIPHCSFNFVRFLLLPESIFSGRNEVRVIPWVIPAEGERKAVRIRV